MSVLAYAPAHVTDTHPGHSNDHSRDHGTGHTEIIQVFVYRFIPCLGTTDTFHLLGPCPRCRAEVPIAVIAQLADLGHVLATGAPAEPSDELRWDPHHEPDCPYGVIA